MTTTTMMITTVVNGGGGVCVCSMKGLHSRQVLAPYSTFLCRASVVQPHTALSIKQIEPVVVGTKVAVFVVPVVQSLKRLLTK